MFAKPVCSGKEHRDRDQRNEGQLPVQPEHHSDDRKDNDQIAQDIDHPRGKKLVQRIDVRGQPRHDPTDRVMVVIGYFLLLQLRKQFGPQVEHHALADIIEQDFLDVGEDKTEQKNAKKRERKQPYSVRPLWRDVVVDRQFRKIRLRADQHVCQKRQRQRRSRKLPVGLQIAQQPTGDAKIIRLSYLFLFVVFTNFFRHG